MRDGAAPTRPDRVARAIPLLLFPAVALLAAGGLGAARVAWAPPRSARLDVRTIFERDCAVCHGNDARGTPRGPSLVGDGPGVLDFWLTTGRMPLPSPGAEDQRRPPAYPPSTIRALIAYIGGLTGDRGYPIPHVDLAHADLARGGEVFRLQCAACHSWAGEGGALIRRAAPPTNAATPTQISEAVRTGPGAMPRFGKAALSDQEVSDVVAYVRYLDHPNDRGGDPLGRIGPLAEGAVAVFIGLGLLVGATRWIGTRS